MPDPRQMANLRDLGGLPLIGGGSTRRGVLYRSDQPYARDAVDAAFLSWPPTSVIDLRRASEVAYSGGAWAPPTAHHLHPLHDAGALTIAESPTLDHLYATIIDEAADRLAQIVGLIAPDGPTLINCVAGKDRTGIVVAMLLSAAAVEREAIVGDYLETGARLVELQSRWREQARLAERQYRDVPAHLMVVSRSAIEIVLDRIEGWPGGTVGWLLEHGATRASIYHWRRRIRDDESASGPQSDLEPPAQRSSVAPPQARH